MEDAEEGFAALVRRAQECRACPRMEERRRVLGAGNGPLRAAAVLVGTAPGRYGAERTGIPFSGDRSGMGLEVLLAHVGLSRADVFITNAVLCNPQDAGGRNAEPSAEELRRCSGHLRETLDVVEAPVIVALGRTAFAALQAAIPGAAHLNWTGALGCVAPMSDGRLLGATYHPGPRVWVNGSRRASLFAQWEQIFFELAGLVGAAFQPLFCTVKDQVR
jgi:uracil-DNA glycosylase